MPQGRSGQVWKISPPSGFDPRTVQHVASRYTDYDTRSTLSLVMDSKVERAVLLLQLHQTDSLTAVHFFKPRLCVLYNLRLRLSSVFPSVLLITD